MALWYYFPSYAPSEVWFSSTPLSSKYIEWTVPESASASPSYGKNVHVTGEAIPLKLELPEDCSYMFAGCTSINTTLFITKNVTNMKGLFEDSLVTSLDLSTWDTSKVTDMSEMFYNASSLTSLNLSNLNTSKVIDMGSMFAGCIGLTSLDLSSFRTPVLAAIHYMFAGCQSLVTILVDGFSTRRVSASTDMFYNCTSIVGEKNTRYNASNVDRTYARVDNPPTEPGYFTAKYHWVEHIPYIKVDGLWTRCNPYI